MAGRAGREEGRRPLYWDSKIHGKAYMGQGGQDGQAAQGRRRRTIEAVPGVRQELGRRDLGGKARQGKVFNKGEVDALEARMRKQLSARRELHKVERVVLLAAFAKVLRVPRIAVQQKLSTEQFVKVWHTLGIEVSASQAAAVFAKYGQDKGGLMPVMVFVEGLLVGAARYLVKAGDNVQRRNPYKAGEPATYVGEILYPQCRKGVFPPSDWDPSIADRSAMLPDIELELDFVYGYSGLQNTAPNLFYLSPDEVIYYTAGVGVKYNKTSNTQCFFRHHDDDVNCLAYSPRRQLAATGQVGPVGRSVPKVCVWDPFIRRPDGSVDSEARRQEMSQHYVLEFPKADRGIVAVAFSPDGNKIATVAMDNSHTMYIWDISKGTKKKQRQLEDRGDALAWCKTMQGAPPATFDVVWSPFDPDTLLTYGLKYIKFYKLTRESGKVEIKAAAGRFGNPNKVAAKQPNQNAKKTVHTITAACFLSATTVVTGNRDGEICTWKKLKDSTWALMETAAAHQKGSKERCVDGSRDYSGVRVLRLRDDGTVLLSGGADGLVMMWGVDKGGLSALIRVMPVVLPSQLQDGEEPPKIVSLDCVPGSDVFMVGTKGCDIFEVDNDPEMLIEGHSADVYGLSMSPSHPHIFATAAESSKVGIWDISRRRNIRLIETARIARSVAWSPNGGHLAIGCKDGGLQVLEFYPAMRQVFWGHDTHSSIDELKYSPCGQFLAVASHDQCIYVYNVSKGYSKVGRCVGHSSSVIHLDWSADSAVIQSSDTAKELLYFSSRTCKQVKENQRDTVWASWSTVQGFSVMGIWKNTSDTTDINACHRSPCGKYLVAADDSGVIRLYNYPCVIEKAPSRDYFGHSSHVMNVRFSPDGKYVTSVGGHDRAVFQWRVYKPQVQAPAPLVAPWVHLGGNQSTTTAAMIGQHDPTRS
eukprot:jgi/Tetstr1/462472/TSEL_007468.t1